MKENATNMSERPRRLSTRRGVKKYTQLKSNNQENITKKNPSKGDKRSVSEMSPGKPTTARKRTAFGDITNAIQAHSDRLALGRKKSAKTDQKPIISLAKTRSRRSDPNLSKAAVAEKKKNEEIEHILDGVLGSELIISSNENTSTKDVLFEMSSASDTSMLSELNRSTRPVPVLPPSLLADANEMTSVQKSNKSNTDDIKSLGLKPYDTDTDPNVVSEYADCVFRNMKKREQKFKVRNYLAERNSETTGPMRAILVDWLVEVQENFELYHETLYLAIKITDNYLQNSPTPKEMLQLVGATSLLISCKIEERHPPPLDDFQFICDDAYTHKQFVQMELKILKALEFDINIPISYRFLRRFARVTSMSMQVLTLSRYILELSLHEAQFVDARSSKTAAACLCLALKMRDECEWDVNFSFHTGYTEQELLDLMIALNSMVSEAPRSKLQTVRTKYSHSIFYEVAKTSSVDPLLL